MRCVQGGMCAGEACAGRSLCRWGVCREGCLQVGCVWRGAGRASGKLEGEGGPPWLGLRPSLGDWDLILFLTLSYVVWVLFYCLFPLF